MIRSSVVFPEPLSPRMVRNSPSAISSETLRSTTLRPKVLATLRMLSRVGFAADGLSGASVLERAFREGITVSVFLDLGVAAQSALSSLCRDLAPLRGLLIFIFVPTAYAVGCILSPLRGLERMTLALR